MKDVDLVKYQLEIEYLDISNNPIESISGADGQRFLKEIVAKNTLIDGDKIITLKTLSPSKVYAISSYWKLCCEIGSSSYRTKGKPVIARVILK